MYYYFVFYNLLRHLFLVDFNIVLRFNSQVRICVCIALFDVLYPLFIIPILHFLVLIQLF